jgi:hypothetical protein
MTAPTPETDNPQAGKVLDKIEETTEQIVQQEKKVENASTPAQEEKENATLKELQGKYDALLEKLEAIDKKVSQPTVPAPEAKQELPPVTTTEAPSGQQTEPPAEEKPRKRRLGAW